MDERRIKIESARAQALLRKRKGAAPRPDLALVPDRGSRPMSVYMKN
jgi:hypothetical protein